MKAVLYHNCTTLTHTHLRVPALVHRCCLSLRRLDGLNFPVGSWVVIRYKKLSSRVGNVILTPGVLKSPNVADEDSALANKARSGVKNNAKKVGDVASERLQSTSA